LASALAALLTISAQAAPDFKAVSVNDVTLRVSDVRSSTKFYQVLFGIPMKTLAPTLNLRALNANCFFGVEAGNEKNPAIEPAEPVGIEDITPGRVSREIIRFLEAETGRQASGSSTRREEERAVGIGVGQTIVFCGLPPGSRALHSPPDCSPPSGPPCASLA
jgi:hypothetical protein